MVRGQRAMAIAVRRPDGTIATHSERLGGWFNASARRIPLLRGVAVLWETLALGVRALTWATAVASDETRGDQGPPSLGVSGWAGVLFTFGMGAAIFFVGPVAATFWLDRWLPVPAVVAIEGALRVGLLLGYLWAIGQAEEIRRVFQYHGAEHMTIRAHEEGMELRVPAIRRFAKEHPRCGTSFLLTVAIVAVFVFLAAGEGPLWWRFASRIVLVPIVAALAYEAIRFAGFHSGMPVVRWLFAGNLALQKLTTRIPDDEQIQVAVAALELARREEQATA